MLTKVNKKSTKPQKDRVDKGRLFDIMRANHFSEYNPKPAISYPAINLGNYIQFAPLPPF